MTDRDFTRRVTELVPVFVAAPGGREFHRPTGWTAFELDGNEVRLKEWQSGWAICALTGHLFVVVDVDPQNGGDVEQVRLALAEVGVRVFAEVATPGGGRHLYVTAHPDIPTSSSLVGFPGVDVQSHGACVFLPGTTRPKYDGGGYTVVFDNLDALVDGGDPDGAEALADWVATHRSNRCDRNDYSPSPPWSGQPPDDRQTAYLAAVLANQHDDVAAAPTGTRNQALYTAALKCGSYVAGAGLDQAQAVAVLRAAAETCGLIADDGQRQVNATIASGLRNGTTQPRAVPDADSASVFDPERAQDVVHMNYIPDSEEADDTPSRLVLGGTFILDTPVDPEPLWGKGSRVLLPAGEGLMIVGDQGLGKTTLGQQLALGRCGFPEYADLLDLPIKPGVRRTLYLAMDRPRQAARSFRRMVGDAWRAELDDRLVVWPGPPQADLAKYPNLLLALCEKADADTVVVDSLKDAAVPLSDDEVGAQYNRARQATLRAGVEVIELHHNRKTQQGSKTGPTIHDVYGSVWLTSGVSSVVMLTGHPGDPIVGLHHVKPPADDVGPLQVIHNHDEGRSRVFHPLDLVALAQTPISAVDAARALFDTEKPTGNEKEKARRKLDKAADAGVLVVVQHGDPRANKATLWLAR